MCVCESGPSVSCSCNDWIAHASRYQKARIFSDVEDAVFEQAFVQWEALCALAPQPPRGPLGKDDEEVAPQMVEERPPSNDQGKKGKPLLEQGFDASTVPEALQGA